VQIVGLVAPEGALWGKYVPAHAHFGAGELKAAVAAHADLIRFQVSQFGIDPQGPLYSPRYVDQVRNAVATARALGLSVIVSLQAEPPAGEPFRCPLPDGGAERAWGALAPMFADDHDVMFELYNEPGLSPSKANWLAWLYGGPVASSTGVCQAVGIQALIDDIRTSGATNVIVVPGLAAQKSLAGMPTVTDPAARRRPQLAYGVHYPTLTGSPVVWDRQFGRASGSQPVVVTEWNANSTTNCDPTAPADARRLLAYLASKQVGLVGFAFDLPGTIVADWSYVPTDYDGFACGVFGGGPGQTLFDQYAAYARTGDGSAPQPMPAWLIDASALRRIFALAPATARANLNTPRAFVTGAGSSTLARLSTPTAVPTARFTDERKLAATVNANRLPAGTAAVVYNDEASRLTPRAQQLHPDAYFERAARVAHKHGLLLIADPATELAVKMAPKTPPSGQYAAFLRLRIAAAVARYADVYVVQAEGAETRPAAYSAFIRAVAVQARAAHPGIELLGALSTNPNGRRVPASLLLGAARSVQPSVSGYAVDDPATSAVCSSCTGRYSTVVRRLINKIGDGRF
jgi:hypothetical protein